MDAQFSASQMCSPDAMSAAAHYIEREYGYGYRIGQALSSYAVTAFEVAASDGSRFNILADKWGNVQRIPDEATKEQAEDQFRAMHREAVAS